MIHYLVAKYVDDLSRNEPINIGVIVYDGLDAVARFDGENEAGKLDRRRVVNRITGSKAYAAWVAYWRSALREPSSADRSLKGLTAGDPRAVEHLLARPGRDFYLERGGTILLDVDAKTLEANLEDLFARLVRQPDLPAPPSLKEKSRQALAAAGAPLDNEERFKEQIPVRLELEGVAVEQEVSYAVMNGDWHFLQEMPFDPGSTRRSKKEASHCAFLFEHAAELKGGMILYDQADIPVGQWAILELLMQYGTTVNVNDIEEAAERLQKGLALG